MKGQGSRAGTLGLLAVVVVIAGAGFWWVLSPSAGDDAAPEPASSVPASPGPDNGAGTTPSADASAFVAADTARVRSTGGSAGERDTAGVATASLGPVGPEDFRVGVRPVDPAARVPEPAAVRGVYVNAWSAGSRQRSARLLELADTTEINAFVIDIKDASGRVSYPSTVPFVRRIGADAEVRIRDVRALLDTLRAHDIYPIARIVVFKDPHLAHARPDWAIQKADSTVWQDHNDEIWVDPYNRNVWDYNIALAEEAVALGFAEVQWDYVRFPDVPSRYMRTAVFPARAGRVRVEAIREFVSLSAERLARHEVPITADVFGLTVSAGDDMGIGQRWQDLVTVTDVLLPMIYPSHFANGSYGIERPNARPYRTVRTAVEHARRRTDGVEDAAAIRPWLQDFSLGDPPYGPAHVRAQIRAVYDAGVQSWVLWNSASRYTAAALAPEDGPPPEFPLPGEAPPVVAVPDSAPTPTIDLAVPPSVRVLGTPVDTVSGSAPDTVSGARPDTIPPPGRAGR